MTKIEFFNRMDMTKFKRGYDGMLRDVLLRCPLTAMCEDMTGLRLNNSCYLEAAREIGLSARDAYEIGMWADTEE